MKVAFIDAHRTTYGVEPICAVVRIAPRPWLLSSIPGSSGRGGRNGESQVIIAHHDTVIHAEDHVIVFVTNKRIIPKVEKLFQVGVGFF